MSIEDARKKLNEMKAKGVKPQRLDPIEKAEKNPTSLRLAINANCWGCAGAGCDGQKVTRDAIAFCPVENCPLHPVRPYQKYALAHSIKQEAQKTGLKTDLPALVQDQLS